MVYNIKLFCKAFWYFPSFYFFSLNLANCRYHKSCTIQLLYQTSQIDTFASTAMEFQKKVLHRAAVLSLYRSLFRNGRKIGTKIPNLPGGLPNVEQEDLKRELTRYNLNNALYMKHLSCEMQYNLNIEFRRRHSNFLQWYSKGIELEHSLQQYIHGEPMSFVSLLQQAIDYRTTIHKEQLWRADYLKNKNEVMEVIEKRTDEIDIRRKNSKIKKPTDPTTIFHKLTNKEKNLVIKSELKKGKEFEGHLLRRYLRIQQMQNLIPNPLLLPYTPDPIRWSETDTYKLHFALIGSTKHSNIHLGYDTEYIDAIIKPSLMYDINKHHHLEALSKIVNERGPFKVKIKTTSSGATVLPFIKMPYPRLEPLKEIALDAKNLLTALRILNVWLSPRASIKEESINQDGSFSIARSHGFGPDECIYPRYYYQELAEAEALWEYLIESNHPKSVYKKEWTEFLDITSTSLTKDLQMFQTKYGELRSRHSKLLDEQETLQLELNNHYNRLVARYEKIVASLKNDRIHKHSELVNMSKRVTTTYPQMLEHYSRTGKTFPGLPEYERLGMGRTLPDYLDENEYHSFRWGQKFYDRFRFDLKRT